MWLNICEYVEEGDSYLIAEIHPAIFEGGGEGQIHRWVPHRENHKIWERGRRPELYPALSAGKKFARFTQKFRRRVRPLFATVVFLGQRVCVPFALHIASLTARGILPRDLPVMTSAMTGSEAKRILNLQCQWNEGGRGSMLKENKY